MFNPNHDSDEIWHVYARLSVPESLSLPEATINESATGRLFEEASRVVKSIARHNRLPLNQQYFDFAMQVFQEAYQAGYESGEEAKDLESPEPTTELQPNPGRNGDSRTGLYYEPTRR